MLSLFHLFTFVLVLFNISVAHSPDGQKPAIVKTVHDIYEDEESVSWSHYRKLTWDDFLSAPQLNTDAVALASTTLGISYKVTNNVFTYEITCSFSKARSWGLLKTDYILSHEQGHFDITEIFARKLHKELSHYKFNRKTYKQDINAIYDRIVQEKEAFQEAYDKQTDHSRKKARQEEWLQKIDDMLIKSEPYSNYP